MGTVFFFGGLFGYFVWNLLQSIDRFRYEYRALDYQDKVGGDKALKDGFRFSQVLPGEKNNVMIIYRKAR